MIRWIAISIFLFINIVGNAQKAGISAYASSTNVATNEYFQVTFKIEGANTGNFRPPKFGKLEQAGGASTSTQMSIVNGRTTQSKSYTYNLVATKPGTYIIKEASIRVKNKTFRSNKLTIRVVKANARKTQTIDPEKDVFIQMELSDSVAFVGQQVILKYTIYTKSDVRSMNFEREPDYDGFFVNILRNYRDREKKITINGATFTKKTIRTYALFPQRTGTFEFAPATIMIGIPTSNSRKSFFGTTNLRNIRMSTNIAKITVKSTPPNAPESFSGAIGSFKMRASIDKRRLTTDEAFSIKMFIDGKGDGRFLQAPKQQEAPNLEYYEPNVISEKSFERGDKIEISKVFEYLVVPNAKGNISVRPEFSYFDIDSMEYRTLYAGPFRLTVQQGTGNTRLENIKKEEDLAPPILDSVPFRNASFFLFSIWYWLIFVLLLAYLGWVLWQFRNQKIKSALDPNEVRQAAANKLAQQRLSDAKILMDKNDSSFFDALYNGLFGYISDKLLVPAAQLNKNDIATKLRERSVLEENIEEFNSLLSTCQTAIYGGGTKLNKQDMYIQAVDIITKLDEAIA